MITLNSRDNSEKLKHMQMDEIRRCQEILDSLAAQPKVRTRRVVQGGEKHSHVGRQKRSSDSNVETIGQRSKRQRRGVSDQDRFLTDQTEASKSSGKV
eukprot:1179980-Rhodomonas_salina.2